MSVWSEVWSREFSNEENRLDIEQERLTTRWKKIRAAVEASFGALAGLETIEIGAGRGIYSLLFSIEGARASLLDNDGTALKRAGQLFRDWGKGFQPILQDAFALPASLEGCYDVAMSYGFAEHFIGEQRHEVFRSHWRLLKPGGVLVVSVPNAAFLPYRLGKKMLETTGKWAFGLEVPFWRAELWRVAKKLGLKNARVFGSSVVGDTLNYWLVQRAVAMPVFAVDKMLGVFTHRAAAPLRSRTHRVFWDPATPLDDLGGYALVLTGER